MDRTQTPAIEPSHRKLRQRHLIAMPLWLARGLREMARARILLSQLKPSDIARLNRNARHQANRPDVSPAHPEARARIGFIVDLLGRKLPWRSDCLIQAMAAQNWLASHGIASEIRIGVMPPEDDKLGAHAWLVEGGKVILGGDIARYSTLMGDESGSHDA